MQCPNSWNALKTTCVWVGELQILPRSNSNAGTSFFHVVPVPPQVMGLVMGINKSNIQTFGRQNFYFCLIFKCVLADFKHHEKYLTHKKIQSQALRRESPVPRQQILFEDYISQKQHGIHNNLNFVQTSLFQSPTSFSPAG